MRVNLISVKIIIAIFFIVQSSFAQENHIRYALTSEMKNITSQSNKTLMVESGMFYVPENRENDNGRTIALAYYRIKSKSKNPASPIFLLAGGPGSSYINSLYKDGLFNETSFYCNYADVIIFDQRGTGNSVPNLRCHGTEVIPLNETLSKDNLSRALRSLAIDCHDFWKNKGIDLSAYNTDQSASDINDLRIAFNYKKIMLIGGSYGSHLGLHTVRKFPNIIERALFHGIEGPDHTWDVPSEILNALKRISKKVEKTEYFKEKLPKEGLISALEQIINEVELNPKKVILENNNKTIEIVVDKMAVQNVSKYKAGKRNSPLAWPNLILDMLKGDFTIAAQLSLNRHTISAPNAMSISMDLASGVSSQRRAEIENDSATQILGDINFSYTTLENTWIGKDLGESFRKNIISEVPILLLHGTWDTSTPIENAYDVLPTLKNGHLIEVIEGTHNSLYELYEHNKLFPEMIAKFIKGDKVDFPDTLELPKIEFPEKVSKQQEDLWDACILGDFKKAKSAISMGADVNSLDIRKNKSGRRPLNYAAFYGHTNIIKLLLDNKAIINAQNKSGFTAMHHAVENNQAKAVMLLIKYKADMSIENKKGENPKNMALRLKNYKILNLLKE